MAGGFGFQKYPQQGTPNAEAVGMALMQQGQGPPMGGAPAPMSAAPMAPTGAGIGAGSTDADASLRGEGAVRMTGGGQIGAMQGGDPDEHGHSTNALNVAVGEAMTRLGGGYSTNPNPYKDRAGHMRQLMQLGLSQTEAHLLAETGGV